MARPGLDRHVKFRRLVRILNEPRPHVRGYLELLWEVGYENGDPVIGDAEAIEAASEYPGEPGNLFQALLECGGKERVGFIEEVPDESGQYQIHDLYDHAPDYVRKRWERELERTRKGTTISEMRAAAGRKGGRSKRKQVEANGGHLLENPSKRKQMEANGLPPAPAPAPKEESPSETSSAEADGRPKSAKEFFDRFKTFAQSKGIPVPRTLSDDRRQRINRRLKSPTWWQDFSEALRHIPIPNDDKFDWQPDLDWLIANQKNVAKLAEGVYDRKSNTDTDGPAEAGNDYA